jgi:hypothetical protein
MNGHSVDLKRHVVRTQEAGPAQLGFKDLFSAEIRVMTLAMIFLWPIVTLAYFGLGLSMTQLGGDIFVSFTLGALTEVGNRKHTERESLQPQHSDPRLLPQLPRHRHLGSETLLQHVSAAQGRVVHCSRLGASS